MRYNILAMIILLMIGVPAALTAGDEATGDRSTNASTRTPTATAEGEATATATWTPTPMPESEDPPTATLTPTPDERATSTPTPPPTSTPTATSTFKSGQNLLVNGDFSNGFDGWSMTNGHWRIHDISGSQCAADNLDWPVWMAEMDIDNCESCNTWEVGDEDWLWQDVAAPLPHSTVILTMTEAGHMKSGTAETRIYGSDDGVEWTVIYFRPEKEAPDGIGKFCNTPPTFTYEIAASYPFYRLEFYGHLNEFGDAWLFGPLSLSIK